MLIVLFVFLARPHKSEDFLRRIFFFIHESAFRPHKTRESAHLNRIYLKPLFRLKLFFFIRRICEAVKMIESRYYRF